MRVPLRVPASLIAWPRHRRRTGLRVRGGYRTDAEKKKPKRFNRLGFSTWRPLGDSNPCYRRERAVS